MNYEVTNPSEYIALLKEWQEELTVLYNVLEKTELKGKIKWGIPVYCYNNKNVVAISEYKNYVSVWFYQGVFLKDEKNSKKFFFNSFSLRLYDVYRL